MNHYIRYRLIIDSKLLKYHNDAVKSCVSVECGGIHNICGDCRTHIDNAYRCILNWVYIKPHISENKLIRFDRKLFSYNELLREIDNLNGQMLDGKMIHDTISEYEELIPVYQGILNAMIPTNSVEIEYRKV